MSNIIQWSRAAMISLIFTTLVGCSWFQPKPEARYIEKPVILHPPKPDPIDIAEVEWVVVNREIMQTMLDTSDPNDKRFAFFMLTADDYGDLGKMMQEVLRYIRQQDNIIDYYRETIPSKPPETVKQDEK